MISASTLAYVATFNNVHNLQHVYVSTNLNALNNALKQKRASVTRLFKKEFFEISKNYQHHLILLSCEFIQSFLCGNVILTSSTEDAQNHCSH